jgi:hypothetical protein
LAEVETRWRGRAIVEPAAAPAELAVSQLDLARGQDDRGKLAPQSAPVPIAAALGRREPCSFGGFSQASISPEDKQGAYTFCLSRCLYG